MGRPSRAVQVMVVEDDGELREELCELLAFEGYHPIGCRDGRGAWTQLSSGLRPDVIVTDLGLPGLSGRELIQLIREQAWGQRIPVLLLSAWENAGRFAIPADVVLVKGGEPEAFARAVDRLSGRDIQPRKTSPLMRRPPRRVTESTAPSTEGSAAGRRRRATAR
jgi:DNA-binding response OmpR family regulator